MEQKAELKKLKLTLVVIGEDEMKSWMAGRCRSAM